MYQLKIEPCHSAEAETMEQLLEDTGALSIEWSDKYDDAIFEPEIGTTPLWPTVVIHAIYDDLKIIEHAQKTLLQTHPHLNCSVEELPDKEWERVSLDLFQPQLFGKHLWICPSWSSPPEPEAVNLILDPGLAFGTGTHPTTGLCLTWLDANPPHQQKVIDYGCGSGILALAALKLGARHVQAIDIDPQALLATQQNSLKNNLPAQQLHVGFPDSIQQPADLILANILLKPLLELKELFFRSLTKNGRLVVSGILKEQTQQIISDYQNLFCLENALEKEDWRLLVFLPLAHHSVVI